MSKKPGPRRPWKGLILVLLNVLAALATAEVGLRLAGPVFLARRMSIDTFNRELVLPPPRRPGDALRPNARGRTYAFPVRTNSLGFRGPEIHPPPPGAVRIAVLGRSVAFGWGAAEKDAWPYVLERLLARKGLKAQVLDLSVPAWTLADIYVAAHKLLPMLEPRILILPVHPEDFSFLDALLEGIRKNLQASSHAPGRLGKWKERIQSFLASPAGSGLFLKEFLSAAWLRLQVALEEKKGQYGGEAPAGLGRGALLLARVLEDIRGLAEKTGTKLVVLDMGGSDPLGSFCRLKGIAYVQARLKDAPFKRPVTLGRGDPHPNPLGHKWIAGKVARAILALQGK